MLPDSSSFDRYGWAGIGVPVSFAGRREFADDAWLAAGRDPQDGNPAISVWREAGATREAALWMTPDGARTLALKLLALAERTEADHAAS